MNWFRKTILSQRFWLSRNKFADVPSDLTVTVVIPAWNEEATIAATIKSIQQQTYRCKIIVVNDRSTDKTWSIASMFYDVQVINVKEKAGSKSQALNKAIPFVDTDIFICVDADTRLEPDSVDRLMRAFNNPDVMVASGFVVSAQDGNFWTDARRGEYIIGQSLIKAAQENLNAVQVASGCFFAIRTEALRQFGFDHRTMAEDMDLTWVMIENGYDVAFVKDARCWVNDPDTWFLYRQQVYRWYAGMFQCIKLRNYDLFSRNPKLGIAVYMYAIMALSGAPIALASIIWGLSAAPVATVVTLVMIYLLMLAVAKGHGYASGLDTTKYPRYVLATIMAGYVNYAIFLVAMTNELILKNPLREWIKGH